MRVEAHTRQQCRGNGRHLDQDVIRLTERRPVWFAGRRFTRSPIVFGMRRALHPFHFPDSAWVAESAHQWVYREDYQ